MALGKHHAVSLKTNSGRNSAHIVINVCNDYWIPRLDMADRDTFKVFVFSLRQLVHNYITAPAGISNEARGAGRGHILISFLFFTFPFLFLRF